MISVRRLYQLANWTTTSPVYFAVRDRGNQLRIYTGQYVMIFVYQLMVCFIASGTSVAERYQHNHITALQVGTVDLASIAAADTFLNHEQYAAPCFVLLNLALQSLIVRRTPVLLQHHLEEPDMQRHASNWPQMPP